MVFADLALSQRLEKAEGFAGWQFTTARRQVFPQSGAACLQHAGTVAMFNGIDSPVTQSFQLGLLEDLTADKLSVIEDFFWSRGATPVHEVSPFAGLETFRLLCEKQYRPIEISNVLYRGIALPEAVPGNRIKARLIKPGEEQLWAGVNARGWAADNTELAALVESFGGVITQSTASRCFLGEVDGQPAAAGVLILHEGVALFGGSATLPEFRRQGLQSALLRERMRHAVDNGCDLGMMVAEAGSHSQRNAQRQGFQVAYTRLKWRATAESQSR